ncbi:hypothetical protein MY11210_004390 [Beauveria gryllotalpidicola]
MPLFLLLTTQQQQQQHRIAQYPYFLRTSYIRYSSEPNPNPVRQAQNNAEPVPTAASCLESFASAPEAPSAASTAASTATSTAASCLLPPELRRRARGFVSRLNSCLATSTATSTAATEYIFNTGLGQIFEKNHSKITYFTPGLR